MRRRTGVFVSLAVGVAVLAGGVTAQAQVVWPRPTAGTCIFDRVAGTFTPGVQDVPTDLSQTPATPLDLEQGTYSIANTTSGFGVCAGLWLGTGAVTVRPRISLQGYFDTALCGSGFLHDLDGNTTTLSGVGDTNSATMSLNGSGYEAVLAGGVGSVRIGPTGAPSLVGVAQDAHVAAGVPWPNHTDGAGGTADSTHGNITSQFVGSGVLQITPGIGTSDAFRNNCALSLDGTMESFRVSGAFTATAVP